MKWSTKNSPKLQVKCICDFKLLTYKVLLAKVSYHHRILLILRPLPPLNLHLRSDKNFVYFPIQRIHSRNSNEGPENIILQKITHSI